MWHKVNFKQFTAGFNLDFFFSQIGYFTKAKGTTQPYYLPIIGEEDRPVHAFINDMSSNGKTISLDQDLNSNCWFHFLRRYVLLCTHPQ